MHPRHNEEQFVVRNVCAFLEFRVLCEANDVEESLETLLKYLLWYIFIVAIQVSYLRNVISILKWRLFQKDIVLRSLRFRKIIFRYFEETVARS